ncbi:MAG: glycosyltransferase [Gloeotrichia echinulata GP01]
MKVAFFVAHFPVLSEPFILNQIVGTIEGGHDVDIYSLDGRPSDISKVHPLVEKYQLMERTIYAPTRPNNQLWRWIKGLSLLLLNFYKNPAVCLQLLNTSRYVSQAKSLKMLYRALPFLEKKSYDIIHCQFSTLGVFGVWFRQLGLIEGKLIATFRGSDISKFLPKWGEKVYQQLFQETDYFLANCEFFKNQAVALGCDANKIHVHGSGIDCTKFGFKERYFPHDGIIRIATTGRLVEKKGIEYVIKAIAQVAQYHPHLEYNIIGDGELKVYFQNLIDELNLHHIVKLLGWKQQKEIVEILDKCHIFVAPSVTGKDGNQDAPVNTLKEAMAMGLPVISTRHGGIPELVEDGVSGFLVPERDPDAIATKLTYLITHPELWEKMGKAGRARVEDKYDMNKLNDELLEIYQQLLHHNLPTQYLFETPLIASR